MKTDTTKLFLENLCHKISFEKRFEFACFSDKNGDFAILTTTGDIYFGREGIPAKTVKVRFVIPEEPNSKRA